MIASTEQITRTAFIFPSLDFPNRTTVAAHEVAAKLRVTPQHIANLIEAGLLTEEPSKGKVSRGRKRVPVASYRKFIAQRLTGPVDFSPQPKLPWPCMEFASNAPLTAAEIAKKFSCTPTHVGNFVRAGKLTAIDLCGKVTTRRTIRVPVESWRRFICSMIKTNPHPIPAPNGTEV